MFHRVIYASRAVGPTGATALSVAQILGEAEANNRRRGLTGCVMFHQGHIMQVLEGARFDVEAVMAKLRADPRHEEMRVLVDTPVSTRAFSEPMCLCGDPALLLRRLGLGRLDQMTANDARAMVDMSRAA